MITLNKYFFIIVIIVLNIGCASVQPKICELKSVEKRLEESAKEYDQYLFEIYFSGYNNTEMALIADRQFEILKKTEGYQKYIVMDIHLTKLYLGRIYRVRYIK